MSMSWLLMAAHVPPHGQRGGMVRYVVEIAKGLMAQPDLELHVVSDPAAAAFWEELLGDPARIHTMVAAPSAAQAFLERRALGCSAFRRRFDVVHGAKHILPRHARGSALLTVHDFLPLDRPGDFGRLKRRLLPAPYLASIDVADALVCVSEATRDRLTCYAPHARERAHVIPLAGSSLIGSQPKPVADLVGADFALVVGDASARKNLSMLIDLWPQVVRQVPSARLAIVGPPGWKDPVRPSARAGVQHLGFLSDGHLTWSYANARVVLCPSVLEGFGLPAREALDLGASVITSEDPALCEAGPMPHVYASDPAAWVRSITRAFERGPGHVARTPAMRTWSDVAVETAEVMRSVLAR